MAIAGKFAASQRLGQILDLRIYGDNWRWKRGDNYRWRKVGRGHGYYRDGVWISIR